MEKTYNPLQIEQHWYQVWESADYFSPKGQGKPYCIMLPPPNVTGSLHMGHGFQHTLMDALIRYHRMQGCNTLWQGGVDHAGIATQMVVERKLFANGQTRHELGREAFIKKVWEWKAESGGNISRQLRRMGSSIDWSRACFTMDDQHSAAVEKVFIDLYREGLIYRGKRLVNWDPKLHTAISDLEVITSEEEGKLWHIRYPLASGDGHIVVATTRPETLFGDVAVAVHPDDERYQHLIGKQLRLPLTDRNISIIADEFVESSFGSGCVKITPAHDFNDYAVGQRHQLPLINIFTADALLNQHVPSAYQGMERFAAREAVINALEAAGLMEKIEKYMVKIPRGDRSGVVVEPYLTDQWYVKIAPLAEAAIAAVETGKIRFVPETWTKTYFQWMHNLEDWCISRQLWWGHRIPAWYDAEGNIYVGKNETEIRQHYHLSAEIKLHQDEDVLDTWFSSALWPFATLGWPEKTKELQTFYPTQVLVTGFDIIFFWVARMIMMGLKFTGEIPFEEVYMTGLIRDAEGQKMSKTKGNVLDPIDLIDGIDLASLIEKRTQGLMQPAMAEKIAQATRKQFPEGIPAFGTDALRFTFCALATTGRDIRFDLGRVEGYRNFCNKIWNAARYVLMNTEAHADSLSGPIELSLADRWIRSRLQHTIVQVHEHFKHYRFDLLAQTLYEFTWNEYCDWYLELSKPVLTAQNNPLLQRGTRRTLIEVLETLLRLLHPLMPYITEEIWQRVAPLTENQAKTIMLQPYPIYDSTQLDQEADAEIEWLKTIILGIRNIRGEMNISPSKTLPLLIHKASAQDKVRLKNNQQFLSSLARLESITILEDNSALPAAATALTGSMELLIPMAGLINVAEEEQRLKRERDKLQKEIERSRTKLANPNYIEKAPAAVVQTEQARLQELQSAITILESKLEKLENINAASM